MSKQILKIERLSSSWWQYSNEEGLTANRKPTDEEREAMGDDNRMYAVYTHGKFSSRVTGPKW